MKEIARDIYLKQLIDGKGDGRSEEHTSELQSQY